MPETIILRQMGLPVFQNKVYANREGAPLAEAGKSGHWTERVMVV
jgi:hypothetical protein